MRNNIRENPWEFGGQIEIKMYRNIRRNAETIGLSPGTLIYIGEKQIEEIKITAIDYNEADFQEAEIHSVEECFHYKDKDSITWINIEGLHDIEVIKKLGNCFGLHLLVLEDILNTEQYPKIEDLDDYICIVLKMLYYDQQEDEIVAEQVSLVLGPNFVLSFQEGREGDVFDSVRARIKSSKGRIRKMGSDYLAYSLIDVIVDSYFGILEKLGEKIELLEEDLVSDPQPVTLHSIYNLKRELLFLRRSIWPLREIVNSLVRDDSELITESISVHLRDVYDHAIQVIDTIETFREIVSGMLDIYLSSISNRMNEVMKVLTIITTIFIPLSLIAGVYGMNFKYMPELEWPWGYPLVLLIMFSMGCLMLLYFKRKKWL